MDRLRVLLANYPIIIPDAIRRLLAEQDDMEVVGDCRGPMKTLQEVGRTKADVVILIQEGEAEPGLCSQLLSVYPDVTILCFQAGNAAFTRQLRSQRRNLAGSRAEDVRRTLREIVWERCGEIET